MWCLLWSVYWQGSLPVPQTCKDPASVESCVVTTSMQGSGAAPTRMRLILVEPGVRNIYMNRTILPHRQRKHDDSKSSLDCKERSDEISFIRHIKNNVQLEHKDMAALFSYSWLVAF